MAENRAPKAGREFSGNMRQRRSRRKSCAFCAEKVESIDFMDATRLRKFISERGKILPKRMTGTCAKQQLSRALVRSLFFLTSQTDSDLE